MKKLIIALPFLLFANNSLLNDLKLKELNYDKQYSLQDAKDTSTSWINPIMLQYSFTKDNMLKSTDTYTKTFSISINQPVFKSGAIYYSIKYAAHSKAYNLLNIKLNRRALIKNALDIAYDYKITKINEEILKLNIENAKIDIKKKKEDFLNGVGDSTFLNNAVLNLNSLLLNLEDMKMNLDNLKYSFKNISSLNLDMLKLPVFKLINKNEYLKNNLELIKQKKFKEVKKDLYKMQIGNQLVSVNFNASLNWQDVNYKNNTPALQDNSLNYYRVGFSINMPISFNALNKIEKTKIDYLKSQILIADKKLSLANQYNSILRELKAYDRKIKIYQSNIKIYDDLISSTKDSIEAGNATVLDLKILQNSRKTMKLNIEILKLKKQKALLNLYYKLLKQIEPSEKMSS